MKQESLLFISSQQTHFKPREIAMNASSHFGFNPSLYWLALGAFAIGTEGFMIAGILPEVARDLSINLASAGQLVTIFALAYAISSPLLTALTGRFNRTTLLVSAMAAFAGANLIAGFANSYWMLVGARILLAFAAGLYMPAAFALASALVSPERRGRALAVVNAGITVAIAMGVPLGTVVGNHLGWRATFLCVAVLALVATVGLALGLSRTVGEGLSTATVSQRLAVVKQPAVFKALMITVLWSAGTYSVYTYLATLLSTSTVITGPMVGVGFFLWGSAAAAGVFLGGAGNDKYGSSKVILVGLPVLAITLASLSVATHLLSPAAATLPVLVAIVIWGVTAWAIHPAQQARLMDVAGAQVAPVALSLNASFLYLGFASGAALGAFTLGIGTSADLGWVGALCECAALALMGSTLLSRKPKAHVATTELNTVN
ncbi:MFS transporter [Pseudomonas sp. NA-150]|uniref:MFS transporter n=1 Tax=Pseudomonas sp. NA-150 TaxID=3367525 RepID=UPI0037C81C49